MPDPDKAPITIKAVPTATRLKMAECASRRGMTMGELLTHMVEAQSEQVARDQVLSKPSPAAVDRDAPAAAGLDVARLHDVFLALGAVAQSSGVPVPKTTARHAYVLLTDQLRHQRGLPRLAPRQTRRAYGQTIDGSGGPE